MLHRFGGPAFAVMGPGLSIPLLLAFAGVVALAIVCFAWRWRTLLAGLGKPPPLAPLTWFRAAGQSLAALIPSARIGGDPLRAWLAVRARVPARDAIATVAIDRALEIGAAMPFSIVFVAILIQQGVPQLQNALFTIALGTVALVAAMVMTARRLEKGKGLVTSFARRTRLDTLAVVEKRMEVMAASEAAAGTLVAQRPRMALAFAMGLGTNLLIVLEFWLLLAAFGLPTDPVAVVAAIFATAAAHQLPVPAGIGVLEGGLMWLFQMLGHPAEIGLAVGLAVRLRELVWALPGIVYLLRRWMGRTPTLSAASPR
jgi:uncharacterized protein (TIRG00374 family)